MKLLNAKLYENEIKEKMWELWYNEKYQYYFNSLNRFDYSAETTSGEYIRHSFAVINRANELIGVITYYISLENRIANWFGAINFSDDIITFGKAIYKVIENCFLKFGMNVVEWCVVCGNPIERSYDRMCKKYGGTIVGIRHKRVTDMKGILLDEKIYEILRENFLKELKNKND